jgi:non-ribosomal peptide synthetase component F
MFLFAAWATVLYRRTGQDDIVVGSPMANRLRTDLEHLVGFCSNTVVLRARLGGNPTFRELLVRVREAVLDAYAHQEVPFEMVVQAVRPERGAGMNPLFQVNFRVLSTPRDELHLSGIETEVIHVDAGLARFDLALELQLSDDGFGGYVRYNVDLFERNSIAALVADFVSVLDDVLDDPGRRLLSLDLAGKGAHEEIEPTTGARIRRFRERSTTPS